VGKRKRFTRLGQRYGKRTQQRHKKILARTREADIVPQKEKRPGLNREGKSGKTIHPTEGISSAKEAKWKKE